MPKLQEAFTVVKCNQHEFQYVGPHGVEGGVHGRCAQCEGEFYAWPDTIYYQEIVAKGRE